MQCDPSLEEDDRSDDDSIPVLFKRNDNDSSDDDDDGSDDDDDSGDDDDDTTVSVNEFDDDINVVIKDNNRDQCHFLLCPSLSVTLVKEQYFELVGLRADQQRLLFRGKMMLDDNSMHSHGVVDGSIIHLVRRMRGGARTTKRKRIHVVSTSFGGENRVCFTHKTGNGNEKGSKEEGGEVTKEVRKEEGGDFKSNHTVLLYFTLIILLVVLFSFYFFLSSFSFRYISLLLCHVFTF